MSEHDTDTLEPLLKRLSLANTRHTWRSLVARAEQQRWGYETFLEQLLLEEIGHRRETRLQRGVRDARFPFLRTVEEFDFTVQSTLRLPTMGSMLSADFVTDGRSVILSGKPGRGKTHLAIAIAYKAIQHGFDARFTTAAALIDELSVASREGRLRAVLNEYVKPHVLVVDEVGYLAYGSDAANVLFHVVNERTTRKRSMVFTTNKPLRDWGAVLHDEDLAAAIVDRILERGRLVRLDGPSMRTRHLDARELIDHDSDTPQGVRVSGTDRSDFPEPTCRLGDRAEHDRQPYPMDVHDRASTRKPRTRLPRADRGARAGSVNPSSLVRRGTSAGRRLL